MRTPPPASQIEVDAPSGDPLIGGDGPAGFLPAGLARGDQPGPSPGSDSLWAAAAALWRRRWLILGLTAMSAVAAVAISLEMPKWYAAETRVLLPEQSGGGMSALIESVAPGASGLLGGGSGGNYVRYLAILTSRTVLERAVERFDLVRRYDVSDGLDPVAEAVKQLSGNTTFEVSLEYNYLAIQILDKDPRTAANIANYFVEELNRESTRLSSESAREQRVFVEQRLREADASLDSVRGNMQALQERYGVTEPAAQGEALMAAIGAATSAVAEADVRYQTLSAREAQYGDEGTSEAAAAAAALAAARGQLDRLTSGNNALMPVPMARLPMIGRQYAQLQQEMLIQAKIIEFVRPMYEQAMFDERRQTSAVQVIDRAIPPVRKAKPKRALVVAGATLSVFVLLCAYVVASALLRRSAPRIARRLAAA